jgi:hypothetical protein
MGFEYRAALGDQLKTEALNKIREFLKRGSLLEMLDDGDSGQILFRWRSHSLDPNWPEDAMITLKENYIYLLIHGATGSEREALIEEISGNLGFGFQEI